MNNSEIFLIQININIYKYEYILNCKLVKFVSFKHNHFFQQSTKKLLKMDTYISEHLGYVEMIERETIPEL